MAQDGMLPKIFGRLHSRTRAPWVAIIVLATGWAMCLGLGFDRLVTLDILIYGLSLALEFAALAVLRIREPQLNRPFRVPGGLIGVVGLGVPPILLLAFGIHGQNERIWGMSSFSFGALVVAAGVLSYGALYLLEFARKTTDTATGG